MFDFGVTNFLTGRESLPVETAEYGNAFEHFIILEVRAYLNYTRSLKRMSYWRSTSLFEVDLIIEGELAIEIKASKQVNEKHYKGLKKLKEEKLHKRYILISRDPQRRLTSDGVEIYPWQEFLDELWDGKILWPYVPLIIYLNKIRPVSSAVKVIFIICYLYSIWLKLGLNLRFFVRYSEGLRAELNA